VVLYFIKKKNSKLISCYTYCSGGRTDIEVCGADFIITAYYGCKYKENRITKQHTVSQAHFEAVFVKIRLLAVKIKK
jgi:hypothetical protein